MNPNWNIAKELWDYGNTAIIFKKKEKKTDEQGKTVTFIYKSGQEFSIKIKLNTVIEQGRPRSPDGLEMIAKKPEIEEILKQEKEEAA